MIQGREVWGLGSRVRDGKCLGLRVEGFKVYTPNPNPKPSGLGLAFGVGFPTSRHGGSGRLKERARETEGELWMGRLRGIYIYIYIERERERNKDGERERNSDIERDVLTPLAAGAAAASSSDVLPLPGKERATKRLLGLEPECQGVECRRCSMFAGERSGFILQHVGVQGR